MGTVEYIPFDKITPTQFLPLLNNKKVRAHLMAHEVFDELKVKAWIASKIEVDAMPGCRARAIVVEQRLAGWCAIQFEDEKYEIAIVMGDEYWGLGKGVFRDMMAWAKALGYKSIFIHLLDTRPEYKFLRKMAKNVVESELSVE